MLDKLRSWLIPLVYLSDNWISLIGVVLVTTCAVFWLFLLPVMLGAGPANPYLGILIFVVFPGAFFLSLVLIPLGIVIERRRQGRASTGLKFPRSFDFGRIEIRRLAGFIIATTAINIVIGSQLSYAAVNYMESVKFCGETCHTVMQPEFTAHQNSVHSRVACVECHVGSGASWFVRSKVSGTRQLFALAFHTYATPIPVPVRNLRPASDTCEGCHWPERSNGDRLRIISKFAEDANNTPSKTVLLMHIGGGGSGKGIHGAHLGPGVTIRYASDEKRQDIPWVSYQKGSDAPAVYKADGFKQEKLGKLTTRVMDCLDCHNRPSHTFQLPDRAVDEAMASGAISTALPFAHKEAMAILKTIYSSRDDAAAKISAAFCAFYQQNYPDVYLKSAAEVQHSAKAVLAIFNRNVFPAMKVTWGSYANNLGHNDFPGCFRCHDDGHASTAGTKITQDCGACHNLLATEEPSPKVLNDLGLAMAQPAASPAPVN